jgi:acetylornithine deacetylase/succinyl-diaminopimelate desuccinylase-like protein
MLEGEEEVGSISLAGFAETHRDLLKADVTIWSDSNVHTSGRPLVILGLKGISSMKITVRGPQIDVHSRGLCTAEPSVELVRILMPSKMKTAGFGSPFYNYQGPGEKEQKAICQIPSDLTPFRSCGQ